MNRTLYYLIALLIVAIFFNDTSLMAQKNKLVFAPQWLPQAQFAGYYVALEKGFYKRAGLDVEILHPSASKSALDYLKEGKADVASSFLMDGIKQRANGVDLVNIAQYSQHSALMIVAKSSSGIEDVKHLDGKRVGIWSAGFDDLPMALVRENNYHIDVVRLLNTINLFMIGGIDAMVVMYYNEYDQIINSGIDKDELNTFFFSDYGLDIPEDGLYCMEATYQEKKEALSKFVKATFEGWDYAATHKDYALELVVEEMNRAHISNNMAHQEWMLDRVLELIEPGNKNVVRGHLMEQDFSRAKNLLKEDESSNYNQIHMLLNDFYRPLAD